MRSDDSIFVDRDLKEHVGVTFFFLDHCPNTKRQVFGALAGFSRHRREPLLR